MLGVAEPATVKYLVEFEGSKARLVSNGVAVLHGRMSGILCRCILAMLDGEMESTLVRVVEGAGLGCLEGVISNRAGLGSLVGG